MTLSSSRIRLGVAVGGLAVLALTSGCGVSAASLHPGAAAEVDGTTISMRTVDSATVAFCKELGAQPNATPIAGAVGRQQMLEGEVLRAVADGMNQTYHFKPSAAYESTEKSAAAQFKDISADQVDDVLPAYTGIQYFADIVTQIGQQKLGLTAAQDTSQKGLTEGVTEAQQWVSMHPITTDPSFNAIQIESTGPTGTRGDLSEAESTLAQTALEADAPTPTGAATAYPSSLPESQQCG